MPSPEAVVRLRLIEVSALNLAPPLRPYQVAYISFTALAFDSLLRIFPTGPLSCFLIASHLSAHSFQE